MPVVKANKGGADANSYATTVEADQLIDTIFGADEWDDIDEDDKARLLITATRAIDALSMKYAEASDTQSLCFPCQCDPDGHDQAKEATIIQALYLYQHSAELLDARNNAIQGVKAETIGPASRSMTGLNQKAQYAPEVYSVLSGFIDTTIRIQRG